jgi:hypothetical protein
MLLQTKFIGLDLSNIDFQICTLEIIKIHGYVYKNSFKNTAFNYPLQG